jgi:DNA-binding transcriptional LysR family regulator
MQFRHLRSFLVLTEELNFSRAAERLHMTQPPLTRQIQQLEESVGAQLFLRTARGVTLTEAGSAFLEEAKKLQFLADQAIVRTQLASRGELGRIDIGLFGSAIFNVIPSLLNQFRKSNPQVKISLHNMTKSEQIEALRERRLSLGFNRAFRDVPDMIVETVLQERMAVAIQFDHPLANRTAVTVGDLIDQPLVLYPNIGRPSFADTVVGLCRQSGFTPNVAMEVEDVVTSIALVSSGFGLCVVPESASSLGLPGVVYRPLHAPGAFIELNCIYRRDDSSPMLQALLAHTRRLHEQIGAHSSRIAKS